MAGDWIKMRVDLGDDPAVVQIAALLDVPEDLVVGKLHRLWSWADRHTMDGTAPAITSRWVDRYVDCSGFADAMTQAGWISFSSAGVVFPSFDRHNGESAKRRGEAAIRQRISRKTRDAKVTPVTQMSHKFCDEPVTREEKSREEKIHILNSGGITNTVKPPEIGSHPPIKIERQKQNYSDFKPEESTLGRMRLDNPGITDAFIDGRLNEFITYAEEHYRPDQLQSRFLKSVNADFKREKLNGHRTRAEAKLKIPTDVNLVMDWARKNSYPQPDVGESMDAYKNRIERNLIERQREAYA